MEGISVAQFIAPPVICLRGMRKIMKNVGQDSWPPNRYVTSERLEYEAGTTTTRSRSAQFIIQFIQLSNRLSHRRSLKRSYREFFLYAGMNRIENCRTQRHQSLCRNDVVRSAASNSAENILNNTDCYVVMTQCSMIRRLLTYCRPYTSLLGAGIS